MYIIDYDVYLDKAASWRLALNLSISNVLTIIQEGFQVSYSSYLSVISGRWREVRNYFYNKKTSSGTCGLVECIHVKMLVIGYGHYNRAPPLVLQSGVPYLL